MPGVGYRRCGRDATTALTDRDLLAQNPEMEKKIGCVVRFKWNEKDAKSLGTAKRDFSYTIIGVQKIWDGRIANPNPDVPSPDHHKLWFFLVSRAPGSKEQRLRKRDPMQVAIRTHYVKPRHFECTHPSNQ